MDHVSIVEHPDDLADRVGLANIGKELVAQTLALGRPLHDAGDVNEVDGCRQFTRRIEELGEGTEPRITDTDDADVGLDRGEWIVRREDVVLGEGVEQRGLADVGQPDDSDGESHEFFLVRRGGWVRRRDQGTCSGAAIPFCVRGSRQTVGMTGTAVLVLIVAIVVALAVGAALGALLTRSRTAATTATLTSERDAARADADTLRSERDAVDDAR